ncbi:MAG TPA: hypothetical protein VF097_07470 [Actinomycetota bacterium]
MAGRGGDRLRAAALGAIALGLAPLGACDDAPGDAGPQRLRVEMREFAFDPSEIALRAGVPVDVRLRNVGRVEHDWTLLAPGGEEVSYVYVQPGRRGRDRFTLDEGTYDLLCTIEGHAESGMVGSVVAG